MMKPRKPRRGKVPVTQSRPAPVQPSRSGSSRFYLSSTQNEEPRVPPLPEQPPPPAYSSDEEAIGCLLQFRASNENRRCLPTQQFAISQQPTGSRMPAGTIRTIPTGLPIPIQELQPMQPPQIPDQLRRERELAQGAGCCSAADCTNCSQNYCLSFDQSMPTFVFTSSEKGSGQPLQAAESAPDASFDRRRVAGKGPDEDIDHLTLQFDNFQLGDDEMNDKSTSEASADFAADDQNEDSDESVNVPEAFVDVPEEMENTKELASDIVDEWNAQLKRTIENVLNSDDDLDIPAEAQNVNVVPNVDVDCSSDVELNVAFNLATSVKKKIDKVQSLSSDLLKLITSHEDATNKPQEAAAKSEKAGSKVRGSNTPVISPSTSDSKRAADEQSSSLEKASSQLEGQKSDDGPGGTLSDASKRVAAVAAVIEQSKQRKILENERRTDFEKPQIQSVPSCRCDAGGNATSGPDPQIQSRPQNFPVQLQRSEPTELQLHLKKCQGKLCKNKYCWPMAQHLTHWLQCVAEDCAICRREADPTREGIKKEIMQLLGKEQATSNGIMDFLTPEGAAVILGYYVEYYFEVFLAYNELRKDRGLKAFEFPNGEVAPETVKEKVSHSCNCLPLANCRDKRCTRLRTILAHWSKWNGLCETNECQLCFRIYGRSRQVAADISPLIEPLRGQPTKAKLDNLKDKLMNMVKTLRPSSPDRKNGSWRNGLEESSRMNLKNGCVIVSILADAEHGELDGNTMENLDLASLFDQPIIYQLLMISKYIIYKAISFREKQLFDESPSMDIFLSMTMQSGVKIVRDVHMFVKTEFCCVEDPWDEGNATMRSCPMPVNKRYLMMMGRKMRNVMSLFATSNVDE